MDKNYLPQEYIGKTLKKGNITKFAPRKWTEKEIEWALRLKKEGYTTKEIAKYLYRDPVGVSIKMKRLGKKDGETYNEPHREDKYATNGLYLAELKPKTVLDLYSGDSFYNGKVPNLVTNDESKIFNTTYTEKAEKLICKLFYENAKFDLIDLDPFGSAYDCFDLSIKMASKGLIITLGEIGHKRWKRLDYVRYHYGITKLEDFTTQNLVDYIIMMGKRNKKLLTPVFIKEYRNISRVYFKISKLKTTEQWNKRHV